MCAARWNQNTSPSPTHITRPKTSPAHGMGAGCCICLRNSSRDWCLQLLELGVGAGELDSSSTFLGVGESSRSDTHKNKGPKPLVREALGRAVPCLRAPCFGPW